MRSVTETGGGDALRRVDCRGDGEEAVEGGSPQEKAIREMRLGRVFLFFFLLRLNIAHLLCFDIFIYIYAMIHFYEFIC